MREKLAAGRERLPVMARNILTRTSERPRSGIR
jgi:hypothetical protein